MFDLFGMMDKIQKLKAAAEETKERMSRTEVSGESSDQLIKVISTGNKQIKNIEIDSSLLTADNKEMLEDLLTNAVNNALQAAHRLNKEEMKKSIDGLIPNIPGLDLGSLF